MLNGGWAMVWLYQIPFPFLESSAALCPASSQRSRRGPFVVLGTFCRASSNLLKWLRHGDR